MTLPRFPRVSRPDTVVMGVTHDAPACRGTNRDVRLAEAHSRAPRMLSVYGRSC
jgi:hypothetical protein